MYREVWYRLRKVVVLTFRLKFCEERVKAYIWRRFASGIVHQGERSVACLRPVASTGVGVGG